MQRHQGADAGHLVVERRGELLPNLLINRGFNAGGHHHRVALVQAFHNLHNLVDGFPRPPNHLRKPGSQGAMMIDLGKLFDGFKF